MPKPRHGIMWSKCLRDVGSPQSDLGEISLRMRQEGRPIENGRFKWFYNDVTSDAAKVHHAMAILKERALAQNQAGPERCAKSIDFQNDDLVVAEALTVVGLDLIAYREIGEAMGRLQARQSRSQH